MTEMTPEVFYEKLFTALEEGKRKGEHTLLEKMAEHFRRQCCRNSYSGYNPPVNSSDILSESYS